MYPVIKRYFVNDFSDNTCLDNKMVVMLGRKNFSMMEKSTQ